MTIGTEGQGIADIIEHGVNGFLVPADDPDVIVQVISSCIETPRQANVIAEHGRKTADKMTWSYNAQQYQALFAKLIEENKK